MNTTNVRAAALALLALLSAAPLLAATPAHKPVATPAPIKVALHSEFLVEINKEGQAVRVTAAKTSKDPRFNTITYGNVLQMWIRHPDGTAEVGLYRVVFDYSPKTLKTHRSVALVKAGGNWGDQEGAATQMIDEARRQAEATLPPLDQIIGKTPAPTATP